jgi:DNA-binding NarL/FixJ family response regulator
LVARTGAIVIADGDATAREFVSDLLQRAGFETTEVDTGYEAIDAVRSDSVSLVLLEIELSDMTGYEVCRELRTEHGDDLPIFFVSGTRTDPVDRVGGLLLGADDFISKPFDPSEFLARVRRFATRYTNGAATTAKQAHEEPRLTNREREVLELLAGGQRQKQIALELSISPKTVDTHVQNLLRKFGVHSRAELVARAYALRVVSVT